MVYVVPACVNTDFVFSHHARVGFSTADVFSRPTMTCDVFYVTAVLLHFHMMLVVKLVGLYHFMILVN